MSATMSRLLRPVTQAVRLMVARAVVLLIDDARKLQSLQVSLLADEVRGDVERFQNYGFTSVPLPGAEALAVAVGGVRDHLVVLAVDDRRYRLQGLQGGEVALYTDEGDKILLKRGNVIEVHAATKVRLVTPLTESTGDMHVLGSLAVDGSAQVDGSIHTDASVVADADVKDQGGAKSMAGMRTVYNRHGHPSFGPSAAM